MVAAGRQMAVRRWQEVYRPAVRLGEPGSDGFHRSWIMLMPEGTFRHPEYGRLAFTRRKLLEFKRHFDAKVRKIDIALDRDHDAKAATGWLEQVEYRAALGETPAGLWGRIRWTSLGVRLLKEQIYRYFSPEFGSYPDEESGRTWENVLIGGALTNRPFLKVMPAVALRERQKVEVTGGVDGMGRRRRMGRARDEGALRLMGARGRREIDDAGDAELEDAEANTALDDTDAALEDGADASGERMDGDDTDGTAGDNSGDGDDTGKDAPSMGKRAGHGASRRASEAVLDEWEDRDTDGEGNESGERDEAVEGLTLRERRMAAQLAETRRQMAEMRYRLYETAVDRVLARWDRQSFQFSVIESRVKDPRGGISGSGATLRRQGMIGLSRAAREAIREVMLS
ncbi:MAG: phage protease, partial [Ktedonobacterales bacterium]